LGKKGGRNRREDHAQAATVGVRGIQAAETIEEKFLGAASPNDGGAHNGRRVRDD